VTIEFSFDDELPQVFVAVFQNGWTWADYHAGNSAFLIYPPNVAIPEGVRVDQIVDWRHTATLPPDGIGAINVKIGRSKTVNSPYDIPRNGGITVYIGNAVFVSAMLRTFGIPLDRQTARERVVSNMDIARQIILDDRAKSGRVE
jgi:hypothetical protein